MRLFGFAYVLAVSVIAFFACARDKASAIRAGQRVPERTLLTLAALGGTAGLLIGMHALRHKTRRVSFQFKLVVIMLVQIALLRFILMR